MLILRSGSDASNPTDFIHADAASARSVRIPRRATDDLEARRAKCPLSQDELESDHGDKWGDVRDILVGLRATSPEAIMRATPLRSMFS